MRKTHIAFVLVVIATFAVTLYVYPSLPEIIPVHWDANGNANGYMPKLAGAFIVPVISLFLVLLTIAIPRIDPKKENIRKFRTSFEIFMLVVLLFLLFIHIQSLFNPSSLSVVSTMPIGIGILFIAAGLMMRNAKRNWFIGIRTPWTLSSERVWNKTHEIGSKLFIAAGIISFIGVAFPRYAIWLIIVPVLAVVVFTVVYSYFEYTRQRK